MSYLVRIPEVPGKIVLRPKGQNTYVLYETGRTYDPNTQKTNVTRKYIGIQIPEQPEMMLPNENYQIYFGSEELPDMDEQEKAIRNYTTKREREKMLRSFFDHAYFEFLIQSRRTPEYPVSREKVKRINRILRPLMKIMEGEEYSRFLELIPEDTACSETEELEEAGNCSEALTCSDVALMLTIFKTGVDQYYIKRML